MIPKAKISKKARRDLDRKQRRVWEMSPVTRVKESGKEYRREKYRLEMSALKHP